MEDNRGTAMHTNEDESVKGKTNVYPDPSGRGAGTLDAMWGEPPHPDPNHHGEGAWQTHKDTRDGVISRVLEGVDAASSTDKKTISEHFEHGKPGNYTTHSALLQHKTAASRHAPNSETLTDQVRRVTGRR